MCRTTFSDTDCYPPLSPGFLAHITGCQPSGSGLYINMPPPHAEALFHLSKQWVQKEALTMHLQPRYIASNCVGSGLNMLAASTHFASSTHVTSVKVNTIIKFKNQPEAVSAGLES
ncbi:hypothetical protein WJX79_002319 [Trebouxia sp. C0005]